VQKLICFDLDGVLVDACEWHRVALNEALQKFSLKPISLEDHYTKYNGLPTVKKLEAMGIVDSTLVNLINTEKQKVTKNLINQLSIDNSKIELLSILKRNGFLIACVTNSIRETMQLMLEKTGQLDYIDFSVTNQDVKNPKPSSEPYIQAMVKLNCFPRNTWIVEDSPTGLLSARNTGATVIQVKDSTEVTVKNIYDNYLA